MNELWRTLYFSAFCYITSAQISVSKKQENASKYPKQLDPYNDLEPELKLNDQALMKPIRPAILNYRPTTILTTATPKLFSSTAVLGSHNKPKNGIMEILSWRDVDVNSKFSFRVPLKDDSSYVTAASKPHLSSKLVSFSIHSKSADYRTPRFKNNKVYGRYEAEPIVDLDQVKKVRDLEYGLEQEPEHRSISKSDYLAEYRPNFGSIFGRTEQIHSPAPLLQKRPYPVYIVESHFKKLSEHQTNQFRSNGDLSRPAPENHNYEKAAAPYPPVSEAGYHAEIVPAYQTEEVSSEHNSEAAPSHYLESVYRNSPAPDYSPEQQIHPSSSVYQAEQSYQPHFSPTAQQFQQKYQSYSTPTDYQPQQVPSYVPDGHFVVNQHHPPTPPYRTEQTLEKGYESGQPPVHQALPSPSNYYNPELTSEFEQSSRNGSDVAEASFYQTESPVISKPLPVTTVAPLPALQKAVQPMLGYKEQSRFEYSSRSAFKHYEIAFEKQLPMASKCPRLDPYKHSSPHYKSDLTCEQGLPGWSKDADCMCEYPVAARDAKGCPTGFYTLCYRGPFGSNALPEDGRAPGNEVAYAPNTTADYQRIVGTQDGNKNEYIQQAVDEYKLKDQRTPEEMKELLLKDKNIIKVIRGKKLLHRKAARVESSVKHERQPKANRRTPSEPNVTPKKSDSSTR